MISMVRHRLQDDLVEFLIWTPPKDARERALIDVVHSMFRSKEANPVSAAIDDCATYKR